jgi:hypothetical protein
MGNRFSLLIDKIHTKTPDQRTAELLVQLQDCNVSVRVLPHPKLIILQVPTEFSIAAKKLNLPIKIARPSRKRKKSPCAWEVTWEPDAETVDTWSKDVGAFWISNSSSSRCQNEDRQRINEYASAMMKALHINAIRLRFLSLGLYDFIVGRNPGENITVQFCDEIAQTFFGCSSSPDEVEKLSLFIQKQARDGRKYHEFTEEHGVETLVIIPPSLDPIV